jgi:predicted DNA-binding transcriptional regulator AlpA
MHPDHIDALKQALERREEELKRRYLRTSEAAHYCGVSASLLNRLRVTGGGPVYRKISSVCVYHPNDLDDWLDSHKRTSTSGDAA